MEAQHYPHGTNGLGIRGASCCPGTVLWQFQVQQWAMVGRKMLE